MCNKTKLVEQPWKTCVVVPYTLVKHSYLTKHTWNKFLYRTCCMIACRQLSVLDLPAMTADCAHYGTGAQRSCKTRCNTRINQVTVPVLRASRGRKGGGGGGSSRPYMGNQHTLSTKHKGIEALNTRAAGVTCAAIMSL